MVATRRTLSIALATVTLIAVPAVSRASSAPTVTLKGGLSVSRVQMDLRVFEPEWKTGFSGGVSAEFPLLGPLTFQPEVLYVMKGFSYGESEGTDEAGQATGTIESLQAVDYVEIPILLRLRIATVGAITPFAVLGPALAFEVKERFVVTGASDASVSTDRVKDFDAGVTVGGGFEMGRGRHRWMIEGRYTHGLSDLEFFSPNDKNQNVQVMTGYVFRL